LRDRYWDEDRYTILKHDDDDYSKNRWNIRDYDTRELIWDKFFNKIYAVNVCEFISTRDT
jgi:hypothetical protein